MAEPGRCLRCLSGYDDDGDGDCAICARWPDKEAMRVRGILLRRATRPAPTGLPDTAESILEALAHELGNISLLTARIARQNKEALLLSVRMSKAAEAARRAHRKVQKG